MKQKWLAKTLGACVLLVGTAWTQTGTAQAISFTPPPNNSAPRSATGGASRGAFFTPPPNSTSPRSATGAASRGAFFIPPSNDPAPRSAAAGASRTVFTSADNSDPEKISTDNVYGATPVTELTARSMLAITPESFYGTTLEARPTVLAYVPASNAQTAVFSLKDEAKNLHYQMSVPVPSQGGIVAIHLPEDAPALEVDKNYQWYLALQIEDGLTPASPFVDGWIKRIEPSSEAASALTHSDQLANVELLASQGIWYDAAAQLSAMQSAQPSDTKIAQQWYELMESVGLTEVAIAPVIR